MILFVRIEHWALLCWQILVGMNHCQLWKPLADADSHNRRTFSCQRLLWPPLLKYLEGLSSSKYLANISGAFVFGFQRLHRLLHLMKFDVRTMLSNCQLCCNPGSVRFAAVSWEKDHFALFLCRAFFPHISEYWTRIQEPYVCIYVLYILVRT